MSIFLTSSWRLRCKWALDVWVVLWEGKGRCESFTQEAPHCTPLYLEEFRWACDGRASCCPRARWLTVGLTLLHFHRQSEITRQSSSGLVCTIDNSTAPPCLHRCLHDCLAGCPWLTNMQPEVCSLATCVDVWNKNSLSTKCSYIPFCDPTSTRPNKSILVNTSMEMLGWGSAVMSWV